MIDFIIISILAVWRATVLLQRDQGPFSIFLRFRERLVMDGDELKDHMFAKGYGCFYCLSVWLSFIPAAYYAENIIEFIIYSLAISAGAIIVDELQ